MRRSFTIIALFIAAILTGLAAEIVVPSLAMAQEPWTLPQWTPFEMTVKPGTCEAQYDGLTAKADIYTSGGMSSATIEAIERVCAQYTRNKGWVRPDGCYSDPLRSLPLRRGEPEDALHGYNYFCYCKTEAIVECVREGETDKTPGRGTSQAPARSRSGSNLASAFDKAAELVGEIARALRDDSSVSNPRPSGTKYVSPSRRADQLYEQGFDAYAKPSHTDEETITALSSFGACIEEDPYHTPCIWQLGWVFWANGDYNLTDILWRRVKQIDPNHASVDEWLNKLQRKL